MSAGDSLRDLEVKPGDKLTAKRHDEMLRRIANMNGAGVAFLRRGAGQPVQFTLRVTGALEVTPIGGSIYWQDRIITVANGTAITLGASVTTYVWLSLSDEFSSTVPTVAFNNGTGGWSGYPVQPAPPFRRHWLLATIVTNSTSITTFTPSWNGGDIPWTPSVFSVWA